MGLFRSKGEAYAEAEVAADVVERGSPRSAIGFVGQPQS
jgi:hypothetical protein